MFFSNDLAQLQARGRYRALQRRAGVDFASNDYLGLANSGTLRGAIREALERGVAVGSGGSRLLRGNDQEIELLEIEAARFFGAQSALYFSSGYIANIAVFACLPQPGDMIFHDALIHASARDGLRLSRAMSHEVPHNDVDAFEDAIVAWRRGGAVGRPWIAVESVYSMDGDQAPVIALHGLAERHGGILVVDEAHATGVLGIAGRGLSNGLRTQQSVVALHTCGKALGCEGALVALSSIFRDFMINRGRPFIFSTAPSPLMAATVRASLRCLLQDDWRRDDLWARVQHAETLLIEAGFPVSGSHIIPIIIGDDARTMDIAAAIQAAGYDVRGIRPPTVPPGTSRLRMSITLNATLDQITELVGLIRENL